MNVATGTIVNRLARITRAGGCALIVASISMASLCALLSPAAAEASTASWHFEPASWDFGVRPPDAGSTEAKAFELVNDGETALTPALISILNEGGSGFELASNTCDHALAPGDRCTIDVTFDPRSGGRKEGSLVAETSMPAPSPATAHLFGSGGEPLVEIDPEAVDFGTIPIPVGAPPGESNRIVTVTNGGSADLSIDEIGYEEAAPTGARPNFFSEAETTAPGCWDTTVPPGRSCSLDLDFSPRGSGTFHAKIRLSDNAADSPQIITLTGIGVPEVPSPFFRDTEAPAPPTLTRRPGRRTKARTATFVFSGDSTTARFQCQIGGGPLVRSCRSPAHFRALKPGRHVFSVRAVGGDGVPGPVLTYRWRILR